MRSLVSLRAQRSGVEKSGFRLNLLFVSYQISPLRVAPRPFGRDDKTLVSASVEMTKAHVLITISITLT